MDRTSRYGSPRKKVILVVIIAGGHVAVICGAVALSLWQVSALPWPTKKVEIRLGSQLALASVPRRMQYTDFSTVEGNVGRTGSSRLGLNPRVAITGPSHEPELVFDHSETGSDFHSVSLDLSVPPAPLSDYAALTIPYTREALRDRVQGVVRLLLRVDAEGQVTSIRVVKGVGYGFDAAAIKLAYGFRFRPARDAAGILVPSTVGWEFVVSPPATP